MLNQERIVRTACRGCHGVCQVFVHVDETGTVRRVTGDPDSATSRGYLCPKGAAGPEVLYHPDRLTRPLRRKGPRGGGQWETISWEEALSEIAGVFDTVRRESGSEYLAMCQGTGRPYTEFTARFLNAFGSPNFAGPGHNCFLPRVISSTLTVGWLPVPDIYGRGGRMPACILVFGNNAASSGAADGLCGGMIKRAMKVAHEVIVVDPRRTAVAASASRFLQLRPGSECALVLAMLHVIIGENLCCHDFVDRYCSGFEELAAHVKPFTPEWAEPLTRVPAHDVADAARAFCRSIPSCVLWGNGIDMSVNAFQTGRALLILMAVTGNLDVPGGMVRWLPPEGVRVKSPLLDPHVAGVQFLSAEQRAKVIGAGRFPFTPECHQPTFWEACVSGKPYRPRAIWLVGTNPLATATRGDVVEQALRDHVEFIVVSDLFLTPTAELADIVLPAAHWLEQEDVVSLHKIWCVLARKKLAQIGETRDDRDVILDLAHRLGLHEAFPWPDRRAYLDWLLEPSGLTFEEFAEKGTIIGDMRYRKYEVEGFPTPSGRVELVSSIMAQQGRPSLPIFVEPPLSPLSTPDLAKEYPFIFMAGCKIMPFFHSEGRNISSLRRLRANPLVDIHPNIASAFGLFPGDPVFVATPYGRARFFVNLDDGLAPDVVHAEHAWWFPERKGPDHGWKESCVNLLFGHEHFDPDSGAEALKCSLCRLEKVW